MRTVGQRVAAGLMLEGLAWLGERADAALRDIAPSDLVVMAYVLDELEPDTRGPLVGRLWDATGDTLVLVEPGTSAGWQRILAARDRLIAAGAHILAPCPHARPCPVTPPDWCHFAARIDRSRRHREAKGGTVPWEDEKFVYLAASRHPPASRTARVLAPPRIAKSGVALKLCLPGGELAQRAIAAREGAAFKRARKLGWGDPAP
jgi:ribosomal protein RSM22 (predicted rRNA methylase)